MKKHISPKAICPYYKHESRQMIDCVGIDDKTVLHLAFANATDSYRHKQRRCHLDYLECPIYQMLKIIRGKAFKDS